MAAGRKPLVAGDGAGRVGIAACYSVMRNYDLASGKAPYVTAVTSSASVMLSWMRKPGRVPCPKPLSRAIYLTPWWPGSSRSG